MTFYPLTLLIYQYITRVLSGAVLHQLLGQPALHQGDPGRRRPTTVRLDALCGRHIYTRMAKRRRAYPKILLRIEFRVVVQGIT